MRYSRVLNEPVMDEVKNSVANDGSDREPKILPEAEDGKQQKSAGHNDFNYQCLPGSSHHGE